MENQETGIPPQPAPVPQYRQEEPAPIMTFGDWLVTLLIMIVPLLNIIMLIIWATDRFTNPSKSNWAKAYLVIIGIQIIIAMFFIGMMIGSVSQLMSGLNESGLW